MSAIEKLTREELLLYRSYMNKTRVGLTHTATDEERAANNKYQRFSIQLNPLRHKYKTKKYNAKQEGKEFTLTFERYLELANSTPVCPLLGLPLDYSVGHGRGSRDNTASLDRIDPNKGYTDENCWIVSMKANQMKSNATIEELRQLVNALERLSNVCSKV